MRRNPTLPFQSETPQSNGPIESNGSLRTGNPVHFFIQSDTKIAKQEMATKAIQLKEDGNRRFQAGDYVSAEALYSKALIADPNNPSLYTNRAMARLRMSLWESVIADCNECLKLAPDNMKAHYYLSQAHLPLQAYDDALEHALKAHELCVRNQDKSLGAITTQVLKCKKERWEDRERRRRRETSDLEAEVIGMLERERDEQLRDTMDEDDRRAVESEWTQKIDRMRSVFEVGRAASEKRRAVPDWAIDDISFGIMVDPVIVRSPISVERVHGCSFRCC